MSVCSKCSATEFYTKTSGPHIGKYCAVCDAWVCWVPKKWQDFVWPIGKAHRGKKLGDIVKTDRSYLEWARENLKGSLQKKANEALKSINIEIPVKRRGPAQQQDLFENPEESTDDINVRDLPW